MKEKTKEWVAETANQLEVSEWQVFELAAKHWNRKESIPNHFKRYILTGFIPWWVRDYCREYVRN
jgi:hypothetical protein